MILELIYRSISEEQRRLITEFGKGEKGVEHPKAPAMKSVISRIRSFLDSKHRRGCFCLLVEKSTEVDFSTISELCKMKERILVYLLFIASIIGVIQWLFLNVNSLLQYNHSV